ncbi:MAG: hypothetical protein MMC33_000272 [Icmadophila ericetorum]|nr:hypothetical protein [Icmadophila ericetorum]
MTPAASDKIPIARSYFSCERVNTSTFLITEDDKFDEHPFIYVKVFSNPSLIVLSDSGCGGRDGVTLRDFIETHPLEVNGGKPLNPRRDDGSPSLKYLIICTHCHYDHILGIPSFQDVSPVILACSAGRSFIEEDIEKHSLCIYLNVPTPKYEVSYWADDLEDVVFSELPLSLQILATPGHTPDELAWYDAVERHLYVGDTFYERVARDRSYEQAIIHPGDGNLIDYMHTMDKLIDFVKEKDSHGDGAKVKVSCGHITTSVDGLEIVFAVKQYFLDILEGKVPVKESEEVRGELFDLWQEDGDPRFSLRVPRRLVSDARKHFRVGPPSGA